MDLQLNPEQTILRDSVNRYLKETYNHRVFRTNSESQGGWSAEIWREFSDLGWLGLPFPVDDGGSGAGAVETSILMEAFGRYLVLEPYLSTIILSGGLVSRIAVGAQRQVLLGLIMDGRQISFADLNRDQMVIAKEASAGYILNGAKTMVLGGNTADIFLVSADVGDGNCEIFAVPRQTRGLTISPFKMVDERRAADLNLFDVEIPKTARLGREDDVSSDVEQVVLNAIGALCSDAVGSIGALVENTVEYTKTRVQFGQPISKFQALQHRMVDMRVKEEEARASCLFATLSQSQGSSATSRAVYGAKAKIGRCARSIYQNAIQLHGAIGTTNELALGAYARRLMAFEILYGSTREHLRRYASTISAPNVAAQGLLSHPIVQE